MSSIQFSQSADTEIIRQVPRQYSEDNLVIIYHANCYDGFCAAWLLHQIYPNATYVPMQYGDGCELELGGKDVLVVDFSFPIDKCKELINICKSFFICDHHKTAPIALGNEYIRYDVDKSGARIVQEYFGLTSNWLVDYTEDRDLWRHKLDRTKEVNATLHTFPLNAAVWDNIFSEWTLDDFVAIGTHVLRYQDKLIKQAVNNAGLLNDIPIVNTTVLHSEIGHELCKKYNSSYSVTYFVNEPAGLIVYSLRSLEDGADISEICKKLGGCGHKHASGFTTKGLLARSLGVRSK